MKKLTLALIIFITLALLATGVIAIAARGALNAVERQSDDVIGLAIDVEDYSISWITASLSLKGIKIYPAKVKKTDRNLLASAKELKVRIMPRAILRKTLHAKSVTLIEPTINITELKSNKFSWHVVKLEQDDDDSDDWHIWIEDVKIKDGILNYKSRPSGHRLKLTDLEMKIRNIKTEKDPEKLPTKLYIKSKIDGDKGTLKVKGKLNAFAKGINFMIRSWIEDAPITYFRSFYAGHTPYSISSGQLNMSTKATARESKLVAYNDVRIYNLRVGGGMKGKLVNTFLKGKRGPVKVKTTVKGDLEKGNFSTASAISKGIGGGILAQARDANPLQGTGTKMKEGTKSIGRGIKGLFGK